MDYINTGYEEHLEKILQDNKFRSVLINGKFGSGKTVLLNHVLNNGKFNQKRILKLKMYEEFIEENYINFMYNSIKKDENKWIRSIVDKKLLFYLAILEVALMLATLFLGIDKANFLLIAAIIFILIFFKKLIENNKIDKIDYIKKNLIKYDYIIIDDLDRVYIQHNEVLKLVQFIGEETKCKLILLGNKEFMAEDKGNLDILEKYYDVVFEVPEAVVVEKMISHIKKIVWTIEYDENLDSLKPIWLGMEPRKLRKLISHIEMINTFSEYEYVKKLNRNDYLFVQTVNINNKISTKEFNEILDCKEEVVRFEFERVLFGDTPKKETDPMLESIQKNEKLLKKEKKYLKEAYEYHKKSPFDFSEREIKQINRIFEQPNAYRIHADTPSEFSYENIVKNFKAWLISNDGKKANQRTWEIYKRSKRDEEALMEFLDLLEGGEIVPFYLYLVWDDLHNRADLVENKPNVTHWVRNRKIYSEDRIYSEIKSLYNLEQWGTFNDDVKVDILCREAEFEEEKFKSFLFSEGEETVGRVAKRLITLNRVKYFCKIFGEKIRELEILKSMLKDVRETIQEKIDELENSTNPQFSQYTINEYYNALKELKKFE